jgi:tetratricopeptide (TPR) repeat protein
MEQIAEGLAFAHANDIVHRDLKPANIHVLPGDKVKIMDFGLARTAGSDMTSTGTVMGTPHYMSPEQVRGQKADARSDVFALGCIFYELLGGKKPFDAESMHGVLFKVMQEEPPPLLELDPQLPHVLVHVVERAMAKDPAERYQNGGELLAALRQTRGAMASGRAHDGERGPSASTLGPSSRAASRSGSDRGSRMIRPPVAPPPRASSHAGLWIGIGVGLLVLGGAGFVASRYLMGGSTPSAAQTPAAPEVRSLAQAVIDTQIELARRRLEAGDFAEAARKAEDALRLDPQSAAARQLLETANRSLKELDAALAAVQAAGNDKDKLAAAAFALMSVDPGRPEAAKAASAAGAAFRARVDQAHALMRQERQKAEQAKADHTSTYAQGADLERQGDQALDSGQLQVAARRYLEARGRFSEAASSSR